MTRTTQRWTSVQWSQVLSCGLFAALDRYFPWELFAAWQAPVAGRRRRRYPPPVVVWAMVADALLERLSDAGVCQWLATWLGVLCAPRSGALAKARAALPAAVLAGAVRQVAAGIPRVRRQEFGRRPVQIVDATCATLADTAANQATYPQPTGQRAGCGFPVVKLLVLMDARSGAVTDWACGTLTCSDAALLRAVWERVSAGTVLVLDRGFASHDFLAAAQVRGVDAVVRQHQRQTNRRPAERLDWVEVRKQPQQHGEWWSPAHPAELRVRVIYRKLPNGKWLKLNTTLPRGGYSGAALAQLYRERWRVETQFRDLKQGQGLDLVAARTPAMVEKVVLANLLALNLLAALRVDVAAAGDGELWQVSLTNLRRGVVAACGLAGRKATAAWRWVLAMSYENPVPGDRLEPRARKRRPKNYRLMTAPRDVLRAALVGRRA